MFNDFKSLLVESVMPRYAMLRVVLERSRVQQSYIDKVVPAYREFGQHNDHVLQMLIAIGMTKKVHYDEIEVIESLGLNPKELFK